MIYGEASFFDGYHFQHIADWLESKRVRRRWNEACAAVGIRGR